MNNPLFSFRLPIACIAFAATAGQLGAGPALEWNATTIRVLSTTDAALHRQARTLAMTDLAIVHAVDAARRTSPDRADIAQLAGGAAAIAASGVLAELWPAMAPSWRDVATRQLAAVPAELKSEAERLGASAAAEILASRANDGWRALDLVPVANTLRADCSSATAALALARGEIPERSPWLGLTPFALKRVSQFEAAPPFTVDHDGRTVVDSSLQHSRLFATIDRTVPVDLIRTSWAEPPLTSWNRIAGAIARDAQLDLAAEARLLATLNVALSDALITAEHARFSLGRWSTVGANAWEELEGQPIFAGDEIREAHDGLETRLVRQHFVSVLVPPVPEYPSIAATLAGAAQAVLATNVGATHRGFALPVRAVTSEGRPVAITRTYGSVADAARESAFAASLDGRHTREACVAGYELGAKIGSYVAKHHASSPQG